MQQKKGKQQKLLNACVLKQNFRNRIYQKMLTPDIIDVSIYDLIHYPERHLGLRRIQLIVRVSHMSAIDEAKTVTELLLRLFLQVYLLQVP